MWIRALIVMLAALNLAAVLWWWLRPLPMPEPVLAPAGVPRLELAADAGRDAGAGAAAAPAMPATPAAGSGLCAAFGPLAAGVDEAAAARFAAGPVRRITAEASAPGGWRVVTPPLPDAAAARALQQRLAAAGFSDQVLATRPEEANTIALGRFATRDAALRHQQALAGRGFAAQVHPAGAAMPAALLFELAPGATIAEARLGLRAVRAEPRPCTGLSGEPGQG